MRYTYYKVKIYVMYVEYRRKLSILLNTIFDISILIYGKVNFWYKNTKRQNVVFLIIGFFIGVLSIDNQSYNKKSKFYTVINSDKGDYCMLSLQMANDMLHSLIHNKNLTEGDIQVMLGNQENLERNMLEFYNSKHEASKRYRKGNNGN